MFQWLKLILKIGLRISLRIAQIINPQINRTQRFILTPEELENILKLARKINPQINPSRSFTLTPERVEESRLLPDGTLGREVARFLDENGFEPINSGDWIQQTHDVWHVLTGFSSSAHDEILLQIFTRAQLFRPTSAVVVLVGLLIDLCSFQEIRQVLKMGKQAQPLIDWDIESDWKTPLAEVRQRLNVIPLNELQEEFSGMTVSTAV
jgi:ubiquinone biosynthesis protein Coq4